MRSKATKVWTSLFTTQVWSQDIRQGTCTCPAFERSPYAVPHPKIIKESRLTNPRSFLFCKHLYAVYRPTNWVKFVHSASRLRLPPFWSSSELELADGIVFPDVGVQPDQPAPASLPNVAVPPRAAREDINGDDPQTDAEADANAEETDERYQLLLTKMDKCRSILVAQAEHKDHRHVMEWEKVLGRSLDRIINSAEQEEIAKRRSVQQDPTQRQRRHQGSTLLRYYR
ncbi:Hypothetical Protein CGB_I0520W [Cryptococcus gattii WM276]|uniref:SWIM-type domain-containing protein n=2 Tax=Cryptococcus gattii TaxID=37769 RepID=E6RBR5_CRYGW|nr:Hypothetical Protein CGB_I0520W [Cryptococcus gattii WM276]ADV24219.1 Hypothetical Protein CGB_I0520W [Cryptococcus gattii WM276]KIR76432.1 hypothetical protein I306_06587 [Cryptococcus gattii EJB2]KJE01016.1 hypothetical protein I311_05386 [Cryptococcus gattii NT-10]